MDRGRDNEEEALLNIIAGGEDDGSQFMNDSGEGMELVRRDEWETNNHDEENVGSLTKSGEVY
jgi:hypothetical protein